MFLPFSVTGLLVKDGKILAVSRKNNPNDFGLPGGKLDPGETAKDAIIREIWEETGIVVTHCEPIFEDKDRVEGGEPRPCLAFLIRAWTGEPSSKEAGIVRWVDPSVITDPSTSFYEYNSRLLSSMSPGLKSALKLA
jgi:8-oxo-dGTP diphosphatase